MKHKKHHHDPENSGTEEAAVGATAQEATEAVTGTLICIDECCITYGVNGCHCTRSINAETKITLDGEEAKWSDLTEGMTVAITGDPATSVEATTIKAEKGDA